MTLSADRIRSQRRLAAAPGGPHDTAVGALSKLLPALIGVLLAVMVISPLSPKGEINFLLDRTKVAVLNDRLRVERAMYRGEDDIGRNFSVTADSAVQHSANVSVVELQSVTARLMLSDGPASLTAAAGGYDFGKQKIDVQGSVNFQASDGYRMVTDGGLIDLNTQRLTSKGRVEGRIPAGTFSADRINADLEQRTVTLEGRARLRMEPGKLKMP